MKNVQTFHYVHPVEGKWMIACTCDFATADDYSAISPVTEGTGHIVRCPECLESAQYKADNARLHIAYNGEIHRWCAARWDEYYCQGKLG